MGTIEFLACLFLFGSVTSNSILTWFLSHELIEKLSKGELPKDEYHCMNNPSSSTHGTQRISGALQAASVRAGQSTIPHSIRSR